MKLRTKHWIFISLSILLLAACGTSGGQIEPSTAVEQDGIAGFFAESATNRENMDVVEQEEDGVDVSVAEVGTAEATPTAVIVHEGAAETAVVAAEPSTSVDNNGLEIGYTADGHAYRGSLDAPIVMEEFSDFQCPYCSRFALETLPTLLTNQIAAGEVVMIYYDFPLTAIHPQALDAAIAARCAGEQSIEAYWGMHDLLFANYGQWSNNNANSVFADYGQSLELDLESFVSCLAEGRYVAEVEADIALGRSRGVGSTPSFFLNDQPLVGAQPFPIFEQAIGIIQEGGNIASAAPAETTAPVGEPPTPVPVDYEAVALSIGDPNAPVRIVEFTDFQCPFCQRHHLETLPSLISELIDTGRVYYSFKDLPLESIHPQARIAANAARCAGEQEAYLAMHDALFEAQSRWASNSDEAAQVVFVELAEEIGLETAVFDQCVTERRYDDLVLANMNEAASFGVSGTPFFFIDGYPINGAQPYELFEFAVGRAEEGTLAEAYQQQPPQPQQQQQQQQPPPQITNAEVNIEGNYAIGDPNAPVTMVEFTDYQCPFCARHFAQTLPSIIQTFVDSGQVYYVFKDFPLTQIHPQAVAASEAARCAGEQGAYMEMHDLLFVNQQAWGNNNAIEAFVAYAESLGLDTAAFSNCVTTHQYEDAINADLQEGVQIGVRGTPTFVINGVVVAGAQPFEAFQQNINRMLSELESE
jgi:protein-disulfide isomerase